MKRTSPGIRRARRIRVVALAPVLALPFALAACSSDSGPAQVTRRVGATTPTVAAASVTTGGDERALTATAKATVPKVAVYDAPDASTPSKILPNPWQVDPDYPDALVPQVFLVKERRPDGWVRVLLPVRPNGSTGWIRAGDVTIAANPYRIRVSLAQHSIVVTRDSQTVYEGKVAVGAPETPTPTGTYYIRVLVQATDPNTAYGPFAYGLSSHSDVLETFNGGDAEIGLHGNDDASVLGTSVTHGCLRMDNDAITMLTRQLPLGTPVDVTS